MTGPTLAAEITRRLRQTDWHEHARTLLRAWLESKGSSPRQLDYAKGTREDPWCLITEKEDEQDYWDLWFRTLFEEGGQLWAVDSIGAGGEAWPLCHLKGVSSLETVL